MRGLHRYKGYTISRGGYVDTPDDRSDGWYVDREESRTGDRRGPGYQTLDEARAAIREEKCEQQTLAEWAAGQPYRLVYHSGSVATIPASSLRNRSGAWHLTDWRVSSIAGGSIWFVRRKGGHIAALEE